MAWKRALVVPLYKGKGVRQATNNYCPISLLSILGKVYVMLLMHMVSRVVEGKLHEVQCGFRLGQGTIDAMFLLHQLANATQCSSNTQLHLAFIDLTKAYD